MNAATAIEKDMVDNIKIAQDPYENPEHDTVETAMAEAKHLFFLGFHYAEENLAKLALSEVSPDINIHGTAFGLREPERARKKSSIRKCIGHVLHDTFQLGANITGEKPEYCISLLLRDRLP